MVADPTRATRRRGGVRKPAEIDTPRMDEDLGVTGGSEYDALGIATDFFEIWARFLCACYSINRT